MVKPYMAMAVQCGCRNARRREDIMKQVEYIGGLTDMCVSVANWELPVRLIAYPEAALQGWSCNIYHDVDHIGYTKKIAVEVPGEETDRIGEIAKRHGAYIVGQIKTVEPEIIKNRHFNTSFVINPKGKVILKHHKLQIVPVSNTTTPHDVWDAYTARFGEGLDAFFQVADTEIGRIGPMICMEGCYPEIARGFAMNGAEILYRPTFPEPWTAQGWWEVQNRARAMDNTCYLIAPNTGPNLDGHNTMPSLNGGYSMIVDYKGQILSVAPYSGEGFACAKINIEELRDHRTRAPFCNFIPTLRTEYYRCIYAEPIYPKNSFLKAPRKSTEEVIGIHREAIRKVTKKGIYLPLEGEVKQGKRKG